MAPLLQGVQRLAASVEAEASEGHAGIHRNEAIELVRSRRWPHFDHDRAALHPHLEMPLAPALRIGRVRRRVRLIL